MHATHNNNDDDKDDNDDQDDDDEPAINVRYMVDTYLAVTVNVRSCCRLLRSLFTRKNDGSNTDTLNFGSTEHNIQPHFSYQSHSQKIQFPGKKNLRLNNVAQCMPTTLQRSFSHH